jgi:hypothetical protein
VTAFAEALAKSKSLANRIGVEIEGVSLHASKRNRLSAALINVSLWHHSSVVALFFTDRYASGLALMRSAIDCFVRSLWVRHLASDEELDDFLAGHNPPNTMKIMQTLESKGFFDIGHAEELLGKLWPITCDFNHGGARMVTRHITSDEVRPNFSKEELVEALKLGDIFAIGAACALSDLAKDPELGLKFLNMMDE